MASQHDFAAEPVGAGTLKCQGCLVLWTLQSVLRVCLEVVLLFILLLPSALLPVWLWLRLPHLPFT